MHACTRKYVALIPEATSQGGEGDSVEMERSWTEKLRDFRIRKMLLIPMRLLIFGCAVWQSCDQESLNKHCSFGQRLVISPPHNCYTLIVMVRIVLVCWPILFHSKSRDLHCLWLFFGTYGHPNVSFPTRTSTNRCWGVVSKDSNGL
jgi:hypothetical protein